MNHADFVREYQARRLNVHLDKFAATKICNGMLMPNRYKFAHRLWTSVGFLILLGGIALVFILKWWIGVLVIFVYGLGFVPALQKSAAEHILEYALENESFYEMMLADKVMSFTQR